MLSGGDYVLAQKAASWGLEVHPSSQKLEWLHRQAILKLKEKYQQINPFKFIIYSEIAGDGTGQLEIPDESRRGVGIVNWCTITTGGGDEADVVDDAFDQ